MRSTDVVHLAFFQMPGMPGVPVVPVVPVVSGTLSKARFFLAFKTFHFAQPIGRFRFAEHEKGMADTLAEIAMLPGRDGQSHHIGNCDCNSKDESSVRKYLGLG